ncbi:carboxymuconolactone decarboxylase family protein [Actinophytocola gossypii]|uniref:Carboxymuconolactone decarboxylase family protein n=1 Tax=Actinophytocola gossypii TaxID=2812003 RepID=A0ABT2J3D5_9PSEU|nr:carboxymuconolactone decarboxylase family protein [Actinophytocola gossypii]MCT2582350.1 carboxymuconolactone decarboxylase family protein [Actinophytocola gossypii]
MTAGVRPGSRREVGLFTWVAARVAGRVAGTGPLNLFLVLGRHRRLFRGWLRFAGRLMPGGVLPRRETELVILRVAHLRECAYELAHHRRLAARAGVSEADAERVVAGPTADGWTSRERALLAATDLLHHERDLSDEAWRALSRHLDERECVELCLLVGHYELLATAIAALRIEPERGDRGQVRRRAR